MAADHWAERLALPRRRLGAWALAGGLAAGLFGSCGPARAEGIYEIDQRHGEISFVVTAFGLFDVEGHFSRFTGRLWLDTHDPTRSRIEVAIDAGAVDMPMADQVSLLRSTPYLDSGRFPIERFASTAVRTIGPGHFAVEGTLQIRGVSRPQVLDAVLLPTPGRPAGASDTADFAVTSELRRSDFGMVADQAVLSDTVQIRIRIRLVLGSGGHAG
jgi:polyisoprenoid-binding protein YceI